MPNISQDITFNENYMLYDGTLEADAGLINDGEEGNRTINLLVQLSPKGQNISKIQFRLYTEGEIEITTATIGHIKITKI